MTAPDANALASAKCVPCEGGTAKMDADQARGYCEATPAWQLNEDATEISRKLNCKTFSRAVALVNRVADVAEAQQHHPDLHLTGYRHLKIVLTTHAIGGLSENDFIVAAQLDRQIDSA